MKISINIPTKNYDLIVINNEENNKTVSLQYADTVISNVDASKLIEAVKRATI